MIVYKMEGGVVFDEVDFLTYITSKETDDVGNNDVLMKCF